MWIKWLDDAMRIVYQYVQPRALTKSERDGADVSLHFHPKYVQEVEEGQRPCLSLDTCDQSYPVSLGDFS